MNFWMNCGILPQCVGDFSWKLNFWVKYSFCPSVNHCEYVSSKYIGDIFEHDIYTGNSKAFKMSCSAWVTILIFHRFLLPNKLSCYTCLKWKNNNVTPVNHLMVFIALKVSLRMQIALLNMFNDSLERISWNSNFKYLGQGKLSR